MAANRSHDARERANPCGINVTMGTHVFRDIVFQISLKFGVMDHISLLLQFRLIDRFIVQSVVC